MANVTLDDIFNIVTNMQSSINTMQNNINTMQNNINTMQNNITTLSINMNNMQNAMIDMQKDINQLDQKIDNTKAELKDFVKQEIEEVKIEFNKKFLTLTFFILRQRDNCASMKILCAKCEFVVS